MTVRLGVLGTGHVGLVTAGAMASIGQDVVGVDNDPVTIDKLQANATPFYEPGMDDLIRTQRDAGRLSFTGDLREAIAGNDVVFICVGTPPREDGSPNLSYVQAAASTVSEHATGPIVVAEKSTVPVRTGQRIREALALEARARNNGVNYEVVSNPEFLREDTAVADTLQPDRVVVGADTEAGHEVMRQLYAPLLEQHDCPYVATDVRTAELIKHASNAFLAIKISFINAVARIYERAGADGETVADAMGHDARIGRAFLNAGLGYGGSCFPKDVRAFVHIADQLGYHFRMLRETERINREAHAWPVQQLRCLLWNLEGRTVAVLGLSFKPGTDDIRYAPALKVIEELQAEGAHVRAHDPAAMPQVAALYPDVTYCDEAEETLRDAHAVVATEWDEYRDITPERIVELLAYPVVVDARNLWMQRSSLVAGSRLHVSDEHRPTVDPSVSCPGDVPVRRTQPSTRREWSAAMIKVGWRPDRAEFVNLMVIVPTNSPWAPHRSCPEQYRRSDGLAHRSPAMSREASSSSLTREV